GPTGDGLAGEPPGPGGVLVAAGIPAALPRRGADRLARPVLPGPGGDPRGRAGEPEDDDLYGELPRLRGEESAAPRHPGGTLPAAAARDRAPRADGEAPVQLP